ncbi:tetratricopeptide repeat protein [Desulforegula conservatrix]|uniref:tetratricopeptide repeat protein n=1 Tax=Desulforegula conservatrix TaxID=153026 RepID=UPI000403EA46|nr:tetratricopeptide repeat protein [Desulforegula conservatrix]
MNSGNYKILKAAMCILLILFMSVVFTDTYAAEKKAAASAEAAPAGDSLGINIEFMGKKPEIRIARVDGTELMIAFRMKASGDDFKIGAGKQKFAGLRYEILPGGAGAIFLKTHDRIDSFDSKWDQDGKNLQVSVITKKAEAPKQPEKTVESAGSTISSEDAEFISNIKEMPCFSAGGLSSAFGALSNENWDSAAEILDEFLTDAQNSGKCADAASFLSAYVFYRSKGKDDPAVSRRMFQEMMVEYPDSPYIPYSALYLGELELSLTGYAPASGYFNYILTEFPDFRAKPQAIYGYAISNIYLDNLVSSYKALSELSSKYPDSAYTEHAAFQQGRIFFKRGDYEDALKRFEVYYSKNKDAVYDSPELLYYLGSSAYHIGNYKKAIEYLSMAYNLFPEIEEPDILFSRIADSYVEEGQLEKAKKIYELVRSKYSGTDGFAVSSVRLAGLVDNQEEKEGIYQEVIDGFPDNPLAKLSMLKLAKAKFDTGDFESSMELLFQLLSENPGATKKEADAFLQLATEKYFSSKVSEGKAFEAVKNFEAKKKKIEPYMNPKIQYLVGKSYLNLGLYEPAYEYLAASAPAYANKAKPPGFDYDLALSMDETGRAAEAKHMFVSASSSDSLSSVDALKRLARIQISEGKQDDALNTYREAFSKSEKPDQKAEILLDQAPIFESRKDTDAVASLMAKAEDLLRANNASPDRDLLLKILKKRGEAEAKKENYLAASGAFERALALKKEGDNFEEISFLLADTYERLTKTKEASEIFKSISEGENDFWAKLAKERLEQLIFFDKLKSPEKKLASQAN